MNNPPPPPIIPPMRQRPDSSLCQYLDQLVGDLVDLIPHALQRWNADAIHHARVVTRRLKAGADLLRPVLSDQHRKPFLATLRKLRRQLGPLRDADVMIAHLRKLSAIPRFRPAADWLIDRLAVQRESLHDQISAKIKIPAIMGKLGAWWAVRRELLDAAAAVDQLLADSLHAQLDAFATQADRVALARPDSDAPAPRQDPHELRISAKALRYTLEMAKIQGHPAAADLMKQFKKMQDALGLWHDFVVLTERAMALSVEHLLAHHDAPLQTAVLALAQHALAQSERQLRRFITLWTDRGADIAADIRAMYPDPAETMPPGTSPTPSRSTATESRTDPDPDDSQSPPAPAAPPSADPPPA